MVATTLEQITQRRQALTARAEALEQSWESGPHFDTRLAQAWAAVGDHHRAARYFRRASDTDPSDAGGQFRLASSLLFAGEVEEARERFETTIRLEPRNYYAWYHLIDMVPQTPTANHVAELEARFAEPDPDGTRRLYLGHALAKACEDLGDYPAALEWLARAKAAKRAKAGYSAAFEDATFAAAAAAYGRLAGEGLASEEPIFIGGMPRSGTSLVEAILGAHPDVTPGGELELAPPIVRVLSGGQQRHVLDAANFDGLAAADLARLGRAYVDATRPLTGETPRFTDKTPINAVYAGIILRALPKARFIMLRRSPMDSVMSFYRTAFLAEGAYPSMFDLAAAAEHYVRFHRLAEHWRSVLPPERYLEIEYEALVADQEAETRRLLAFLGLAFDASTLRFHERPGVVITASAAQVRQPLFTSAIGRWKRYGDHIEPAARVLREAGIPLDREGDV